ncbi:MAG: CHAT domain-containing protein [Myxococcales bacterium]|nr:CHAT domain-containing protein [Myxococcales bacterium]
MRGLAALLLLLAGIPPAAAADPVEAARALLRAGRTREAAVAWEAAADAAADDATAARWLRAGAYAAWRSRDFGRADRLLDAALARGGDDPVARASVGYYRGLVLTDVGAWRRAEAALTAAAPAAQASPALALGIAEARAWLAQEQGRPDDAVTHLLAADPPEGAWHHHATSLGWALLNVAADAGQPAAEARAWLDFAVGAAEDAGDAVVLATAHANLAWACLLDGDLPASAAHITEVRDLQTEYDEVFLDLVDGDRLLALADAPAAEARFAAAEARARRTIPGDSEGGWRGRFGLCRARGTLDDCYAALAELERLGTGTALKGGRGSFFASRRALLAWTLDHEPDAARAFTAADGARARVLRALQARVRLDALTPAQAAGWQTRQAALWAAREALEAHLARADLVAGSARTRWRATAAARQAAHDRALAAAFEYLDDVAPLTAPAGADAAALAAALQPDEALLALTRHHAGWLAFFVADGRVERAAVGDDPLAPFAARLAGRHHLYVVPGGHPAAPGLHRAQLADRTVSYLPYAGLLLRPPPSGAGALVIADARRDLPASAAASARIAQRLGARLLQGDAATRAAVLAALPGPGLIHFAGHGQLVADDPWAAWLALAQDDRLALPDVLTRPVEADLVVLSGCETGPDAALGAEAIGLPAAFLAAGAATVIASDRPVPDAATARLFEAFYQGEGPPAARLRAAALALDDATGAHFRVWGRR